MLHKKRIRNVKVIEDVRELAEDLTQETWVGCQGFKIGDYYLLNDSTSEDSVQEYVVIWSAHGILFEIESVTFGWMNTEAAELFLKKMLDGAYNETIYRVCSKDIISKKNHKCALCA